VHVILHIGWMTQHAAGVTQCAQPDLYSRLAPMNGSCANIGRYTLQILERQY
jgi:hypothetical protein